MTVPIEELLAHRRWVSALARSLVNDSADDLVQDAWIAALEAPPRDDRAPRSWLSRVVRNTARMRARSQGRSERREHLWSLEPTVERGSPEEDLGRARLAQKLTSLVLSLDEPYRHTVVLRYFDELSAAEIGRRTGVPPTTVRSRLELALDRLRAKLDASSGGDRSAWKLALAPLFPASAGPRTTHSGVTLAGVLATATLAALALAVAASVNGGRAPERPLTPPPIAARRSPAAHDRPPSAPASRTIDAPPTLAAAPASAVAIPRPIDEPSEPPHEASDPPPESLSGPRITTGILGVFESAKRLMIECYELEEKRNPSLRGTLVIKIVLESVPGIGTKMTAVTVDEEQTDIRDPEFLRCAVENVLAAEEELEHLIARGDEVRGPINIRVPIEMPPPPDEPPSQKGWQAPSCPTGTAMVGAIPPTGRHAWCEKPDGTKSGPERTWDTENGVLVELDWKDGERSSSVRMTTLPPRGTN